MYGRRWYLLFNFLNSLLTLTGSVVHKYLRRIQYAMSYSTQLEQASSLFHEINERL